MAMVARHRGLFRDLPSDARLINVLGAYGQTGAEGTTQNGLIAMALLLGLRLNIHGPGPDLRWIDDHLGKDQLVIAQGNSTGWSGVPTRHRSGHYVLVFKKEGQQYWLNDPLATAPLLKAPDELHNFIATHHRGGFQIAVR